MALEMGACYKSDWDSSCTHLVWVAEIIAMFEREIGLYVSVIYVFKFNHWDGPWVAQSSQCLIWIYNPEENGNVVELLWLRYVIPKICHPLHLGCVTIYII
jgi:hypothetical protein